MAVTTTCEICGNERVYERSGCPPSTCSEECRKEKLRRYHKAYFERRYATDAAFRERRKAQTKERNRNLSPEKRRQYHENGRVRRVARCEAINAAKRAGNAERHAQFVERLYAEGYLLVPETAQMIGITVPSLRQCMVHSRIAFERRGGRSVIAVAEAERYIREQRNNKTPTNPLIAQWLEKKRAKREAEEMEWLAAD